MPFYRKEDSFKDEALDAAKKKMMQARRAQKDIGTLEQVTKEMVQVLFNHYQDRRVAKLLQIENALADREKEDERPGVRFEDMLMSLGMDTDTVDAMIAVATKSNSPKVIKLFETLQEKSDNVNPVLQQLLRT